MIDATAPPGATSPILLHDGKEARPIARLVTSAEPPVRPAPLPPAPALPSNGLPAQLDLKNALRVELALGGPEWMHAGEALPRRPRPRSAPRPAASSCWHSPTAPIIATVFHLHGHHFRLLDRLDDGWKPFWLDTLAIEPGQTQRIAFLAEYAGRCLLESAAPIGRRRASCDGMASTRGTDRKRHMSQEPLPPFKASKHAPSSRR